MTTLLLTIRAALCGLLLTSPDPGRAHDATEASAPVERVLARSPTVEISKTCPKLRYIGRDATFEIMVTNRGDGPATNVVVTDAIPSTVEFVSADNDGKRDGAAVVWRLGTLEAGASKTLKVNVRCNQIATVRNAATVSYCAEAAAECEFPVKGVSAILLECVDDPDPIEVGGQVTYTITVTNQGSQPDTNIKVVCTLPPEQELAKAGGATEGKADGQTIRFAPLATLAPKARATFSVTAKGTQAADVRFRVELTSDQLTSPVLETESTHIY
jgi:uncharacterized repeat protein (TIGR01451 family)